MTFKVRLGHTVSAPLPRYGDLAGGRWEYVCGWCSRIFCSPRELITHVCDQREAAA